MHLKTIINLVYRHPGFVYAKFVLTGDTNPSLLVTVKPRVGSRPICSGCNRKGPGYDTLAERRFEFIPLWGIMVFLLYSMRRVDCSRCGATVETVPREDTVDLARPDGRSETVIREALYTLEGLLSDDPPEYIHMIGRPVREMKKGGT